MPAAEMHMFICVHFFTNANSSGQTSGQKIKNAYTIYTLNIHFLYSKSAYTIYTPETTFPAGSSTSNGPVTTLPPRKFAGSRQKYTKQLLSHLTFCRHIQRSKAKQPQCNHYNTSKRGTYLPSRRHIHIFSPIFPASFKTANMEYTSNRRRKKRKRGIKRC